MGNMMEGDFIIKKTADGNLIGGVEGNGRRPARARRFVCIGKTGETFAVRFFKSQSR